jgi:hypothetical protein
MGWGFWAAARVLAYMLPRPLGSCKPREALFCFQGPPVIFMTRCQTLRAGSRPKGGPRRWQCQRAPRACLPRRAGQGRRPRPRAVPCGSAHAPCRGRPLPCRACGGVRLTHAAPIQADEKPQQRRCCTRRLWPGLRSRSRREEEDEGSGKVVC